MLQFSRWPNPPRNRIAQIQGSAVDYVDQTFEDTVVELDGNNFENCTFRNVIFQFSGGDLVMKNCDIDRFSFQFGGALANGLYAIQPPMDDPMRITGPRATSSSISVASSIQRSRVPSSNEPSDEPVPE